VRPLIICNFVTRDGCYEDVGHALVLLFTHQHPDYW